MKEMKNVVTATTANGSKSNEMIINENAKIQMAKMKSVENGEVKAEDVEVQKLEEGKLYYGCSNNSVKTDRIVYVVMREHSRGVDMVEYEEWSRNVNGYDENGYAKYVWTMKRYRKSVKLYGNAESMVRTEYVDGPHGVSANHTITEEEMKRNSVLNCGLLEMTEEDYNAWKTTMNELNMRGGLRAYYTPAEAESMDEVDSTYVPSSNEEKEAAKTNADGNARVEWLKENIVKAEEELECIAEDYGVESRQFYDFGFGDWVILNEEAAGFLDEDDYEEIQDHGVKRRLTYIHNVLDAWSKELNELYAKSKR